MSRSQLPSAPVVTPAEALAKAQTRIATLLHSTEEAARVIAIVRSEVARNSYLAACEPYSIVQAVCDLVAAGLTPGALLGEGWLVPYKTTCKAVPGYKGFVKLALQSGIVSMIEASVVYKDEPFSYERGTQPFIKHVPSLDPQVDADIVAAYAVAWVPGAPTAKFEVLSRAEIEKRRAVSADKREDAPWKRWYAEQAKKTAIRALAKTLPMGDRFRAAEELDMRYETGQVSAALPHESPETVTAHVAGETRERAKALRASLVEPLARTRPHAPVAIPIGDAEQAELQRQAAMDEEMERQGL